jgi:hypothetical protein
MKRFVLFTIAVLVCLGGTALAQKKSRNKKSGKQDCR